MDFAVPELGEGVYEAEMLKWLVKVGDTVKRGQPLLEVMTDKATMEIPSPFAGKILSLDVQEGVRIKVGQNILKYESSSSPSASAILATGTSGSSIQTRKVESASPATNVSSPTALMNPPSTASIITAPSIRHLARKLGIDLSKVEGTGPGGRILLEDVTPLISRVGANNGEKTKKIEAPRPDYGKPGTRVPLMGLRRLIAEHLVDSARRIPHFSYIDECDVSELVRLRSALREPCAAMGIKLTYLPFFVHAIVSALKEIPIANSSLDEAKNEIVFHDHYNIGVAVATPGGLIVPVIKDADKKDIFSIAREIDRLAHDARNGKSRREDLKGGTFTLTSVGNIGGLISTPIINHPEVGIVGVGKVIKRPIYDEDDNLIPAHMLYLSFSFDHRVVDGAVCAAFGNAVIARLKNPAAMLLPRNS
ncbi:MAG: 2-oxo acid dehydrogenase subunit E2 [Gemmataceae bacterium]|nr:2-oxo acid dehydrogenase subunit E2 [Gemmataceae bacterium]